VSEYKAVKLPSYVLDSAHLVWASIVQGKFDLNKHPKEVRSQVLKRKRRKPFSHVDVIALGIASLNYLLNELGRKEHEEAGEEA